MHDIFSFLSHHWILAISFLSVLIALIITEIQCASIKGKSVGANELVLWMNREKLALWDTRDEKAFKKGHILHAKLYNLSKASELKKNQKIFLICEQGRQSPKIATELAAKGLNEIYTLEGGMQAWRDAGLPVVNDSEKGN